MKLGGSKGIWETSRNNNIYKNNYKINSGAELVIREVRVSLPKIKAPTARHYMVHKHKNKSQTKRSVICLARETAVLMAQVVEKPHVTDDHDDVNQKLMSNDGIVVPNPKPSKGLTSKLVDLVEKLIVKLMYDSSQPHHYLAGNFAPVIEETPPTKDLNVIGHLPVSLPSINSLSKFSGFAIDLPLTSIFGMTGLLEW